MKNIQSIKSVIAVTLGLSVLGVVGCSKNDRAEAKADANKAIAKTEDALGRAVDKVKDVSKDAKDSLANAWDNVKNYSFDKKDDFTASAKALAAKLDAETASLTSEYKEAQASASRKAAMEELKNSRADFDSKMSALGKATSSTWESAKSDVVVAWKRVQEAYYKARAN